MAKRKPKLGGYTGSAGFRKRKRRIPYAVYLMSAWWQKRRKAKLKSAGYRCEDCKAYGVVLHVHHLTYVRLWRERDRDLQVLCIRCHKSKHPNWK